MQLETLEQNLRRHVYHLADEIGERNIWHPDALHVAEEYVTSIWREQGYTVERQAYQEHGVPCANLEVTRQGTSQEEQIILLGAHYDSVQGSPGANDNASGVAVLLELSRLFRTLSPAMTIRFVAFTNEEPPFFFSGRQGSRLYAKAARRRGDDIRLMLALETMGYYSDAPHSQRYPPLFRYFYPHRADFISLVSNFGSRRLMHRLARAFRHSTDFPLQHIATFAVIPGVAWSDHLSFWIQRYKALMVTDTAFYRYPYYHSAQDTAEKLDYARLAQVCDGLFRAVSLLADERL
ncbi:M28 family peptidase [Sulfuriflexus mobilis]|uniref:M28 family peptidase n=1 Tax=Sulfuriflexus mobilis TaxID=1811807 RepID=UPI000F82BC52|nr:M28 family peptidase [Sulfuriflexus mobilis]